MNSNSCILIADTEFSFIEPLCMVLGDEGYDCHFTTDRLNIRKEWIRLQPNLMILDVDMIQSNDELMKLSELMNSTHPVLLLAQYDDLDQLFKMRKLGFKQYLLKPIDFNELLDTIQQLIDYGSRGTGNEELNSSKV